MQYLLDTDTCIELLRGTKPVVGNAAAVAPDDCAVSTVTAYELLTGVFKCRHPETERHKVESLLGAIHLLPFDRESAESTAMIRARLEKRGHMIGSCDVMLAGQSLAAGLTLVTSNVEEFGRVRGLRTANWRLSSRK